MSNTPRLTLAHATLAVKRFDDMLAFYRDVLGFHVTNQGEVPGGNRMSFVSQDPNNHHQIVLVEGEDLPGHGFVMAMPGRCTSMTPRATALSALSIPPSMLHNPLPMVWTLTSDKLLRVFGS